MAELPPDCLTQIFLNLNFLERVRLETVCQLWHYVLQGRSCFSDMRKLNIADFLMNTTTDYYQQESISLAPTVLGVVERCGAHVHSLSFGNRWLKVSQHIIDCITENCDQVREIDLGAVILNADIHALLENSADRLEHLSLEETSWVCSQHAEKVASTFAAMKQLKSLNLRAALFNIENIVHLPDTLREINISGARQFSNDAMVSFLLEHPKLRCLRASPCNVISQEIIDALAGLCRLESLELGFIDQRELSMLPLAALTQLRVLELRNVQCLNENSLSMLLSSMTQLQELAIRRCDRVHDYSSLAFCERLTSLTITDTMQLCDDDLLLVTARCALKLIHFANCINVTSDGISHALSHCQLRELILINCTSITDEAMLMLAHTQNEIRRISIQGCTGITSKGVATIGFLRNLRKLRFLDVSRNRAVDNFSVQSLYTALQIAWSPSPWLSSSDTQCHQRTKERCEQPPQPQQSLTLAVSQTSIGDVEKKVADLIQLAY